jgi:hypothetical protein
MSIPFGLLEAPLINYYFTMSTYHYAFNLKDEKLEDHVVNKVQGNEKLGQLGPRRTK